MVLGCAVGLWAAGVFVFSPVARSSQGSEETYSTVGDLIHGLDLQSNLTRKALNPSRRRRIITSLVLVILTTLGLWNPAPRPRRLSLSHEPYWDPALLRPSLCIRRPLSVKPLHPPHKRPYRKFDDVLLVVFFSHARYDTNLDHYLAVYQDYFPKSVLRRHTKTLN